jgi:hypothetical protein
VRSGSTLLTALLASHSQIASFPETMFFRFLIGNAGTRYYGIAPKGLRKSARALLNEWKAGLGIGSPAGHRRVLSFLSEIQRDDLKPLYSNAGRMCRSPIASFLNILDNLAMEHGKPIWVEKSPDHLGYLPEIARYIPQAKYVHILRNGPDNIASIYDAANKYPDTHWKTYWGSLERCVTQWKHCVSISRKYADDPTHLLVSYDDLINDPPAVLRGICGFLGVEYEDKMVTIYGSATNEIVLEQSEWKDGVQGGIRTNTSKFDIFNDEQKTYIIDQLNEYSADPLIGPLCAVDKTRKADREIIPK